MALNLMEKRKGWTRRVKTRAFEKVSMLMARLTALMWKGICWDFSKDVTLSVKLKVEKLMVRLRGNETAGSLKGTLKATKLTDLSTGNEMGAKLSVKLKVEKLTAFLRASQTAGS